MHKIFNLSLILFVFFILVVGVKELANNTLNVRTRDNKIHGEHAVDHVIQRFKEFAESRIGDAEEKFWRIQILTK